MTELKGCPESCKACACTPIQKCAIEVSPVPRWFRLAVACAALGVAAALWTAPAQAGTVGVHIGSQHFPAQQYNNLNPGAYYIADTGVLRGKYTVGAYWNSERRLSAYAGQSWDFGPVRLQAGLITGYQGRVLPLVAPSVSTGYGFRVAALPKVESGGSAVIHLTWEALVCP